MGVNCLISVILAAGKRVSETAPRTRLTDDARIEVPLLCGAMYPCSNPELVAAVSEAGGLGVLGAAGFTVEEMREATERVSVYW